MATETETTRATFYFEASTTHINVSSLKVTNPSAPARADQWSHMDRKLAEEIASEFPKSYKVRAYTMCSMSGSDYVLLSGVSTRDAFLAETRANGGTNEAGISRMAKIARKAIALGHRVELSRPRIANLIEPAALAEMLGIEPGPQVEIEGR